MNEGTPASGSVEVPASGPKRVQRMVGVGAIGIAVCLGLALLMMSLQRASGSKIPASLRVVRSAAHAEPRTGKLVWTGTVKNESAESVNAPWIMVTIYDPSGASVDSGEAMATGQIGAGGSRVYTSTFDTRWISDLRVQPVLETPNSRPLGM